MRKGIALVYGGVAYLYFLGVFLYAIWFVWTMDRVAIAAGAVASPWRNLLIDAGLLTLFAVQHSGMARVGFKKAWVRLVPWGLERSTYVIASSTVLLLLVVYWQPLPWLIWDIHAPFVRGLLNVTFWLGWAIVLLATYLIDHFALFGIKQVVRYARDEHVKEIPFQTPGMYTMVRHPLYLGFVLAFWSAPTMTAGRLFFAVMTTAYILVAIQLEERDLMRFYGDDYAQYRRQVPMLIPWRGRRKRAPAAGH